MWPEGWDSDLSGMWPWRVLTPAFMWDGMVGGVRQEDSDGACLVRWESAHQFGWCWWSFAGRWGHVGFLCLVSAGPQSLYHRKKPFLFSFFSNHLSIPGGSGSPGPPAPSLACVGDTHKPKQLLQCHSSSLEVNLTLFSTFERNFVIVY